MADGSYVARRGAVERQLPQQLRIRLERGTFDPLKKSSRLAIEPELEAPEEDASGEQRSYLVQFHTQAFVDYQAEIARLGGAVFTPIPEQAVLVNMTPRVRKRVEQLPYVRWVGTYHPAYKLPSELSRLDAEQPALRYSILLMDRDVSMRDQLVHFIASLGGEVHFAGQGALVEASLDAAQLALVAHRAEVLYIDLWSEQEADMDVAREISGATFLETAGNRNSRPEAWAKNVLSVGGVAHFNTLDRSDDSWSIGPADDGRIKPDLWHFYDLTRTASNTGDSNYREFGGTSGATPITGAYSGLVFQMWADGVFAGGPGLGRDVFANRPHASTAKALMIHSAFQYSFSGTGDDKTRVHQGWGMADVQNLYELAEAHGWGLPILIDESAVIAPLETHSYALLSTGTEPLKVTLVYTNPPGSPSAAIDRINDLTLRVTSPGGTVYWGNNGLLTGNWSTSGGSPNTLDTVENVFIQNPAAGTWTIEVRADEVVQDSHVETPALDADYALVASGGQTGCTPVAVADAGADRTINEGGSTTLGTAAQTGHTYSWSPGGATTAQVTVSPTTTTTYTVTATTSCGSAQDSVAVTVIPAGGGGGPQTAVYDAGRGAPACATLGSSCDSLALLDGVSDAGPEPNQPNTLDGCADGTSGNYHDDESNDRIVVSTLDSSDFSEGATVQIDATVYAWSTGSSDTLDLYYAADANSPSWTLITSIVPPTGGLQTLSAQYTLPAGALQAVRAKFRYQGSATSSCTTGNYNDHDDLVFAVDSAGGGSTTVTFTSIASEDGRMWENSENGNVGGGSNSTTTTNVALRAGDLTSDRQYKSIVSFDTSSIPAGATITQATLRLRRGTVSGTNPFTILGSCLVDIHSTGFGGSTAFATSDWQVAATATGVATMSNAAANGDWSEGTLNAAGRAAVNTSGTTQLRVAFSVDDNDDNGYDYMGFYSGENATANNRPQLVITYQ